MSGILAASLQSADTSAKRAQKRTLDVALPRGIAYLICTGRGSRCASALPPRVAPTYSLTPHRAGRELRA